jgi:GAF domain-containing protein
MGEAGRSEAGRLDGGSQGRGLAAGQAEQVLATYRRVLRLVATAPALDRILGALVEATEAHCDGAVASVLLMDEEGEHLRHGAAPGLPDAYNRAVDGLRVGPSAGSCGTAAHRREPVIVEDVRRDPLWEEFRDLAREFGIGACWSHPFFSSNRRVLGTLALYYREPRAPKPEERELVGAVADLAGIAVERHLTERKRRSGERRLLQHKSALVELAKSDPLARSDFRAFCRLSTEAAAETLGVERVGVWLLNETRTVLRCESLYELSADRHSFGAELQSRSYPRYFAALERGRSVVAHDARRDPDTSEFRESYLEPIGITSMLDAPIRRSGRLVGVVCHEHVGPARTWAADEQDFAASIGDFLSLALEASRRRRAEQAFRSAQEELLRQDFQARRQIEFELARIKSELGRQSRLAAMGQTAAGIADGLCAPLESIARAARWLRGRLPPGATDWIEQVDRIESETLRAGLAISGLLENEDDADDGAEAEAG